MASSDDRSPILGRLGLIAGITALAALASGCSGQPGYTAVIAADRVLLVSSEIRDGTSGPEALFEGRIVLTDGNCVVGEAPDGRLFNLDFPAGTTIDPEDPALIVLPFVNLPFGEDIALGGGYSSGPDSRTVTEDLPEDCRQAETFHIFTAD